MSRVFYFSSIAVKGAKTKLAVSKYEPKEKKSLRLTYDALIFSAFEGQGSVFFTKRIFALKDMKRQLFRQILSNLSIYHDIYYKKAV